MATPGDYTTPKRMAKTQAEVDMCVEAMRTNVDRVLERDRLAMRLEERSETLLAGMLTTSAY